MEQMEDNGARAVDGDYWCGKLGPSSKMQGHSAAMMSSSSSQLHAGLSSNSQRSVDFADIKDRIRSGLSKCMSHSTAHLKDEGTRAQVVIAGGIAGLVARFVIAPLDVVKIRLQLQTHSLSDPLSHEASKLRGSPIYKGTLPTIKRIVREEGLTGLWKGNIPAELMYVSYSAIQFTTYRSVTLGLQSAFGERKLPATAESLIAGGSAGAVATIATYPLDLLRTRFAAQGNEKVYTSFFTSIREIAQQEGPTGFYRGVSAGVGQIVPYMGILFAVYETLRKPMADLKLPFGTGDVLTGGIASVTAKTIVFPFDLIRKRLQVQGPTREKYVHKNIPVYRGVFRTMRDIVKNEGKRGLYRGLTVSLFKAAPSSAVTMWTYERVLKMFIEMHPKDKES